MDLAHNTTRRVATLRKRQVRNRSIVHHCVHFAESDGVRPSQTAQITEAFSRPHLLLSLPGIPHSPVYTLGMLEIVFIVKRDVFNVRQRRGCSQYFHQRKA
jgi:hypothetical protein